MAQYRVSVTSNGRPVPGASVTFWTENPDLTEFRDKHKAIVYSDRNFTTAAANPQLTDSLGEAVVYIPSFTLMAVGISRTGYGERVLRDQEVFGSDPT